MGTVERGSEVRIFKHKNSCYMHCVGGLIMSVEVHGYACVW